MDLWQRARVFAKQAAKKSQELTKEAAKRSQEITIGSSKLSDVVLEASRRSKQIAAEASRRSKEMVAEASKQADQIKVEALKKADQIKSQIPLSQFIEASSPSITPSELEAYGVTDELRDFVQGITISTFQDFPLEDDLEMSNTTTVSNIRQDLREWQEKHAKLVLATVKEISKLRYQLCPRVIKERKFWRIYFILVNSFVAPYEKRYMENVKQKTSNSDKYGVVEIVVAGTSGKDVVNQKNNLSSSSASEQDLDVFLLGDDIDDGRDEGQGDEGLGDDDDDDLDKL